MCFLQGLTYHIIEWQHLNLFFDHKGEIIRLSFWQFWVGANNILLTISCKSCSFLKYLQLDTVEWKKVLRSIALPYVKLESPMVILVPQ